MIPHHRRRFAGHDRMIHRRSTLQAAPGREPSAGAFHRHGSIACLLVLPALILAMLPGCDNGPARSEASNAAARPDGGFIAFVAAGRDDPLFPIIRASAQRAAGQLGGGRELRFYTPQGNTAQDQVNLLRTLNDPEMRGLCIHLAGTNAATPVVERMFTRGIRVVSLGQPLPSHVRFGHVGVDNEAVGRLIAEATLDHLGRGGTIMLLHADVEHPIYGPRLIAFRQAMRFQTDVDVFAEIDCMGNSREARRIIRDRSARFPRLSAWVALDDWPIHDLDSPAGLFGPDTSFITFGGLPRHWPLVESGRIPRLVVADYGEWGAQALRFCETAIREEQQVTPRSYAAPVRVIDAGSLDAYIDAWNGWSSPPDDARAGAIPSPGYDPAVSGETE